ncbi:serine hydrolase domain-containing protein [Undibacterium sp. Tian12W]|uniref:serine hydrolase domain-containing protein n=1 Tax=Undibacterium sp. Tian12W TaxID=3413054 RepID=UPI003BF29905
MINKHYGVLLAAASLLLAVPGQAADTADNAVAATPLKIQQGQQLQQLQQLASKHQVCTAALVYIRNQQIQEPLFAKGCEDAVMPDASSIFQAASLSKPLFAYAVLKLAAQGKLALDEPLMQYLPQGYQHLTKPGEVNSPREPFTDPRLQKVTARMVLQHTAGLPNWASGKLAFESEPGTRWQYSGEGYVLLQAAIESITGMGLQAWMQQAVFAPLDMQHSSYEPPKEWQNQLIAGSLQGKALPSRLRSDRRGVAAASLHTSIGDYARFVQAVLKDTDLQKQIFDHPVMADQRSNTEWGLGWGIAHTSTTDRAPLLWHWGNNYGYRAFVIAAPATGDAMILLTGSDQGLKLAQALTANIIPGQLELFQFPMLGLKSGFLCQALSIC